MLFIQNWINCGRMVCEMNNRYHNIRPLTTMDEVPSTLLPKLCIFYIFLAWFVFMFFCRCFKCSLLSFSIHHFFLSHTRDIEWKTFLLKCLTLACRMPLGFFFQNELLLSLQWKRGSSEKNSTIENKKEWILKGLITPSH